MKKNNIIPFFVLALTVWSAALYLSHHGAFQWIENALLSWRYRYRLKRNPMPCEIDGRPVVMVALDDDSLEIIDPASTGGLIPRTVHARVVETLARHGARTIMTDFYFPGPSSDAGADAALAEAAGTAGNVVIGTRFEDVQELDPMTMELVDLRTVVPPYAQLEYTAAGTGVLNVDTRFANQDGVVREVLLGIKVDSVVHPSLAVSAAGTMNLISLKEGEFSPTANGPASLQAVRRRWKAPGEATVTGVTARTDFVNPFGDNGRMTAREGFRMLSYADCLADSYWVEGLRNLERGDCGGARRSFEMETRFSGTGDDAAGVLLKLIDLHGTAVLRHLAITETAAPFRRELAAWLEGTEPEDPITIGYRTAGETTSVEGAVCLLAPWSEYFNDLVLTPLGRMRGACLHGNLMITIASDRFLRPLDTGAAAYMEPALLLMIMLGIAWLLTWRKLWIGALLAALFPVGTGIVSMVAFARGGIILDTAIPVAAQAVLVFTGAVGRFFIEQKERLRIKRLFSRYVAPDVVSEILRNPDMLGMTGKKVDASVLFLDICGFTSFSEKHTPEEVFQKLNTYLEIIVDSILRSGGTLDKFIGDAVMAVFGAPVAYDDHMITAVDCALDIRDRLGAHNRSLEQGKVPFMVRIGINSGFCVAGNVGTSARSEYTVIGDTVNLASRLESSASPGEIIISESTRKRLEDRFKLDERSPIAVKGKKEPQRTYVVRDRAG